jgi:hypothetical protein
MISELEDEGSPFLDPQVTNPRINPRLCLDVAELSLQAAESAWPGGHGLRWNLSPLHPSHDPTSVDRCSSSSTQARNPRRAAPRTPSPGPGRIGKRPVSRFPIPGQSGLGIGNRELEIPPKTGKREIRFPIRESRLGPTLGRHRPKTFGKKPAISASETPSRQMPNGIHHRPVLGSLRRKVGGGQSH